MPVLGPRWVSRDARLVIVARALRTFGYGCTSVLLAQMLVEDGDPPARIGILLAVAATGSVVASILMGLFADRFGRRSSLLLSAGLMGMAGVVFAVSESYPLLLAAAFVGTVSPSTNDNTPFSGVEQAILAQTCPPERHTAVFARYGMTRAARGGPRRPGRGRARAASPSRSRVTWPSRSTPPSPRRRRSCSAASPRPPSPSRTDMPRRPGRGRSTGHVRPGACSASRDCSRSTRSPGGLAVQAVLALWFQQRYGASTAELGLLFFATNLLSALSQALAPALAARRGLLQTMLVPHFVSNVLLLCVPVAPELRLGRGAAAAPPRALQDRRARPAGVHRRDRHARAAGRGGEPDHRRPQRRRVGEPADVEPAARGAPARLRGPAPARRRPRHRLRPDHVVQLPGGPDGRRRPVVAPPAAGPPPRARGPAPTGRSSGRTGFGLRPARPRSRCPRGASPTRGRSGPSAGRWRPRGNARAPAACAAPRTRGARPSSPTGRSGRRSGRWTGPRRGRAGPPSRVR